MFFDVLVDHAGHRRAQAGQVRTAVTLRDIVGEAQHLLIKGVVPLHRHIDRNRRAMLGHSLTCRLKHRRVQHVFVLVDVLNKAARSTFKRKTLFLASALISELDMHAVVQEGQFADALGEYVVMKFNVGEDLFVGPEMNFGTTLLGITDNFDRRYRNALLLFDLTILRYAVCKLHEVLFAIAPDGEL